MLWIKRNLFLAAFGVLALVLLGGGAYYLWSNYSKNREIETQVDQAKTDLENLYRQNPFPNATNIAFAREQLATVRTALTNAQKHFTPIPYQKVEDKDFRALMENTVFELQRKAVQSGVILPKKDYAFSFEAQKGLLTFSPGSFPGLAEQLAEIKVLSSILFDAKVNKLIAVKRPRLTVDDPPGSVDYHDLNPTSNMVTRMVSNPYEAHFQSFSGELGAVIEGLYKSPHGFIVRTVKVQPVDTLAPGPGTPAAAPAAPPPPAAAVPPRPAPGRQPPRPGTPGAASRDNLVAVLNEKLLNVVLQIDVIKPIEVTKPTPPITRQR